MTGDDPDPTLEDGAGPEEAFALVGNEIRAEIIRTLGDAQGRRGPPPTLSFSELRSRVDLAVDSSRFNYHLGRLVGQFVDRTDRGYRLRAEGRVLHRTIRAGTFDRQASRGPFAIGVECYFCEAPVEATYDDGLFWIRCSGCEHSYSIRMVPPSVVDEDDEQVILSRIDQYERHKLFAAARGVCDICVNGLDTEFIPADEIQLPGADDLTVSVHRSCDHCGNQQYMSVGSALVFDPNLVAFYYEHGLDLTRIPLWELEFRMTDRFVTVRSTDPWEVALEVTLEGDTLELLVDEELSVVECTRS